MQLTDLMTYAYADTDTSGPDANGRRNDRARGRNLPRRGLRLVVAARGGIGSVRTGFFCRQRHAGIFGELVFKLAALSGEGLAKVALGLLKLSRSLGFILIARTAAWPFWLRLWTCESIAPGSTTNPAPPYLSPAGIWPVPIACTNPSPTRTYPSSTTRSGRTIIPAKT